MRSTIVLWLALLIGATAARAEELGLDLTDSNDYRPTVAVMGVTGGDSRRLAFHTIAGRWAEVAVRSKRFSEVVTPAEARNRLAQEERAPSAECTEVSCFELLAVALDVNQLLVGTVRTRAGKSLLKLYHYVRFDDRLEVSELVLPKKQSELEREAAGMLWDSLASVQPSPLGIVEVQTDVAGARGYLGTTRLGALTRPKRIPAGHYTLRVEAPDTKPLRFDLTVDAHLAQTVAAMARGAETVTEPEPLAEPAIRGAEIVTEEDPRPEPAMAHEALPVARASAKAGPNLLSRPGFYVAAGGVIALAMGMALGASAKGIESRITDRNGDGVMDITRREINAARAQATVANVLIGVGATAAAAGTVWFFVHPLLQKGSGITPNGSVSVGVAGVLP